MRKTDYPQWALYNAREWIQKPLPFTFSELEEWVLKLFFTNMNRKVFFVMSLPSNMSSVLLAMYSRMKNPRGLRGTFVDSFLPGCLSADLKEVEEKFDRSEVKFLKENKLDSLEKFILHSEETRLAFHLFMEQVAGNPEYIAEFAQSPRVEKFLAMWLDSWGHNSIVRVGDVTFCCEGISVLAAKSIEWARPGAGYIELSTRFVDMSGKDVYPIDTELARWGVDPELVGQAAQEAFNLYRALAGENNDGPVPAFLRKQYGHLFPDEKSMALGVLGETCDYLGNILPASTLTSVGVHAQGEAFQSILRHLRLDDLPETIALADAIVEEAASIGLDQFARHCDPTIWEYNNWNYLGVGEFTRSFSGMDTRLTVNPNVFHIEEDLRGALAARDGAPSRKDFNFMLRHTVLAQPRAEHDKLPREFERIALTVEGLMSFRSWRDWQRQGFSTHLRTPLTPHLGFYRYPKKMDGEIRASVRKLVRKNRKIYELLMAKGVPVGMAQYVMLCGWNVGHHTSADMRQWEFVLYQRSKQAVHDEVRQAVLDVEHELRFWFPWWYLLSRTNRTRHYVFARGQAVSFKK